MKWQYTVSHDEAALSRLGEEGWELVSALQMGEGVRFYLKKPFLNLAEQITEQQRKEIYRQLGLEERK